MGLLMFADVWLAILPFQIFMLKVNCCNFATWSVVDKFAGLLLVNKNNRKT